MNEQEIKEQLCDICHKMWQLGWVAANDGNVSVKLEDGTFFATPTGMSKSFITPDKLVRINDKGEVLKGAPGLRPFLGDQDAPLLLPGTPGRRRCAARTSAGGDGLCRGKQGAG